MQRTRRKARGGMGYRRILWPTDFSHLASAALPHAARLAGAGRAELVILHVLSPPAIMPVPDLSGAVWTRILESNRAAAQTRLKRLADQVRRRLPGIRVQGLLAEGQPEIEILRTARRLRCDAILLATHGRTGLAHVLIGSVAERVLRMAPCPVLIVRHPSMRSRRA